MLKIKLLRATLESSKTIVFTSVWTEVLVFGFSSLFCVLTYFLLFVLNSCFVISRLVFLYQLAWCSPVIEMHSVFSSELFISAFFKCFFCYLRKELLLAPQGALVSSARSTCSADAPPRGPANPICEFSLSPRHGRAYPRP